MTCREDNVLSAIAKERDPDLWMRREHHCRQNQIKTVIVSLVSKHIRVLGSPIHFSVAPILGLNHTGCVVRGVT